MKTSDYIVILIAGGIIFGAIYFLSKPRTRTVPPQYENIEFGVDLGRKLGLL